MLAALSSRKRPLAIGGAIVAFFIWWQFAAPDTLRVPLKRLEALAYDLRLNLSLPEPTVDRRIVIIDIDEKSLQEVGHWPWPRHIIAQLVDRLAAQGVAIIGFDIVFPEAERNSAENIIEVLRREPATEEQRTLIRSLQQRLDRFDNNLRFADALRGRDVVLGYVYDFREDTPVGLLPAPPPIKNLDAARQALTNTATNFTANIPSLQQATPYGGFFSLLTDRDGIIRRAPMLARIGDHIYPSLSVEILRLFQLVDEIEVHTALIGERQVIEGITIGQLTIPTDSAARAVVPYRGGWGSFSYISATDVLNARADNERLEGAIALIGTTAHGLFDLRSTPVQSIYPGVEVHANLIAGALDQRFASRPEWANGVEFIATLALGLLIALLQPLLTPLRLILGSLFLSFALITFNFLIWQQMHFILEMALPLLMLFTVSTFNLAYGFLHEARARRELKGMFGQYIPPQLVQEMSDHPEASYGFEGELREMTVMFSDIRNFTAISETLPAGQLKQLLNRFFSPMTRIIFEQHGTIDKYVGDMIMAFWGAPMHNEQHARHAVQAGLEMLRQAVQLDQQFQQEGLPALHIGIGINSGPMNVGDMGSEYRRAYTVLGDAVNQGSRLEALTKFYGVSMLIGEATYLQLQGAIPCREIDRVRVKGKREAVRIYEPLDLEQPAGKVAYQQLEEYALALQAYRRMAWQEAHTIFCRLEGRASHPLYQLYAQRCAHYRDHPPASDWDGVYQHRQKGGGA
ncbi:MAG: adenylate/guanylate cyclase domain-containing protein [Gammaproteobacteria bacterium]|nr:adenylate/guanylate cyclase domain-containing protein [Gammaproteobacteria bacterium]